MEQERSNAMIRSVTNELERTRPTFDAAQYSYHVIRCVIRLRLASLERELNEASRALQMAQMAPMDSTQESYLTLQNELRKSLGEITRMQIELSEKDELEAQLVKLRKVLWKDLVIHRTVTITVRNMLNKLLIDLNAAKREVEKAKSLNRAGQETGSC